jgi:hypothetical protein
MKNLFANILQKKILKAIFYSAMTSILIKQGILYLTGVNILSIEMFAPLVPLYDKIISIFGFFFIALNNIIINLHIFKEIFKSSITLGLTNQGTEVIISSSCDNGEGSSKNTGGDSGTGGNSGEGSSENLGGNNGTDGGNNNNDNKGVGNEGTKKSVSELGKKISSLEERQKILQHQLTDTSFSDKVFNESVEEYTRNSDDINSLISQLDGLTVKDSDDPKLDTISEKSDNESETQDRTPSPDIPYEGKGKGKRKD